jgi:hypothetical protein
MNPNVAYAIMPEFLNHKSTTQIMKSENSLLHSLTLVSATALAALLFSGCHPTPEGSAKESATSTANITNATSTSSASSATSANITNATSTSSAAVATSSGITNAAAAATATTESARLTPPIRIKAGATEGFTDSSGNKWLPDQGYSEGDIVDRPDMAITNTPDQQIYRAERYSMSSYSFLVPNGKYTVKLHFCETYDGITGTGQRVFSFNVAGHEFKDFDVWAKAGGSQIAYVETVPVEVTDGKLTITFTPNVENPQINGIEILPAD